MNSLCDIAGIRVGHAHDLEALTGCTVVLCPPGTIGGVDQRGGAPGTRETDLLRPLHLVNEVHAVLLTGGSAFGLAAADGVMRYLEAEGVGYATLYGNIPIVPAAVLYDLGIGNAQRRPDSAMGHAACLAANTDPARGNVGAGLGATVGKIAGTPMKGGLGMASIGFNSGLVVAALFAVNALGDVVAEDGSILAGARNPADPETIMGTMPMLASQAGGLSSLSGNTVIGIVATNAKLSKEAVNKVAQMAHDGLARAVRPAHLMFDGDTIFSLATGTTEADVNLVGAWAAEVSAAAIRDAVLNAETVAGVPAARSLARGGV
jgi:L-aminopeptidase/D-esterase-like protein